MERQGIIPYFKPLHHFISLCIITKSQFHEFITTRFRPIKEVTVLFASNIACPYLGCFSLTGEQQEKISARITRLSYFDPHIGELPLHSVSYG